MTKAAKWQVEALREAVAFGILGREAPYTSAIGL